MTGSWTLCLIVALLAFCKADCSGLSAFCNAAHGLEQLESLRRKGD